MKILQIQKNSRSSISENNKINKKHGIIDKLYTSSQFTWLTNAILHCSVFSEQILASAALTSVL